MIPFLFISHKHGTAMRIADSVRRCVVFLGHPGSYIGTGFLVRLAEEENYYFYLVTAGHVARLLDAGPFVVRANLLAGQGDDISIDNPKWRYHPAFPIVDLAALEFSIPREYDHAPLTVEYFVDEATRKQTINVGAGSLSYVIGLFHPHTGKKRILPIVHTGNVALEPSHDELIETENPIDPAKIVEVEGYLVEAHTLPGCSGSPVFVRRSVDLRSFVAEARTLQSDEFHNPGGYRVKQPPATVAQPLPADELDLAYGPAYLLGLWQSSWSGKPEMLLAPSTRTGIRVPVGMGIVVPADKIIETLNLFLQARKQERDEAQKLRAARFD